MSINNQKIKATKGLTMNFYTGQTGQATQADRRPNNKTNILTPECLELWMNERHPETAVGNFDLVGSNVHDSEYGFVPPIALTQKFSDLTGIDKSRIAYLQEKQLGGVLSFKLVVCKTDELGKLLEPLTLDDRYNPIDISRNMREKSYDMLKEGMKAEWNELAGIFSAKPRGR